MKHRTPPEDNMPAKEEPKVELVLEWDIPTAKYRYCLYTYKYNYILSGFETITYTYTGTKEWAQKQAKHFGLEMPEINK